MTSLSPEARARLAAFRSDESPDELTQARVLAAVQARARAPATPEQARRLAELEPAAPQPRRRAIVLGALALAAGLLLAARWATTPARHDPNPAVQAPHQAAPDSIDTPVPNTPVPSDSSIPPVPSDSSDPAPSDSSDRPAPPPPSDTPASRATLDTPVPTDMSRGTSTSRRPRPRDSADDIAAEVALLREAKLAGPARRRSLLDEHARRFPTGAFAAERGLLEVETLCELGELAAARAAATRFTQKHPGSPLASRIAQTCAGSP